MFSVSSQDRAGVKVGVKCVGRGGGGGNKQKKKKKSEGGKGGG